METPDLEKSKAYCIVEILEYMPNSVFGRTIVKKLTGNIVVSSLGRGEGFSAKISPFDTFIQIIEGRAEIEIDGESTNLMIGDGIIVPAHKSNSIKANERFKMISTGSKADTNKKTVRLKAVGIDN
jgi:quercetin dioxygenase-like cupin family protein